MVMLLFGFVFRLSRFNGSLWNPICVISVVYSVSKDLILMHLHPSLIYSQLHKVHIILRYGQSIQKTPKKSMESPKESMVAETSWKVAFTKWFSVGNYEVAYSAFPCHLNVLFGFSILHTINIYGVKFHIHILIDYTTMT